MEHDRSARPPISTDQDLFRLALEAAATGMILVDHSGAIVLVNEKTELLFGYERSELIGRPVEILVPRASVTAHPKLREAFFRLPTTRPMGRDRDLFGVRKDGTELPVEIGLNPVRTASGDFVLASVADITARKRAVEQFRLALEAAPTGMIMVDTQGRIVLVNAQTEVLFGYTREELIGEPVEILVPERLRARHPEFRSGFFTRPHARPMGAGRDLYGVRKDGSEIPIEIGLNPLQTPDGSFVLSSVVDISERKRAEAQREQLLVELRSLNATLEARSGTLRAALAERETLLQEIHHRVKNNLQVISSLIHLRAHRLDENSQGRIALDECQTRVQAIALIHEQLYQSKDFSRVAFSEYAETLARTVLRATSDDLGRVQADVDVPPLHITVDQAIPCGLILNELITNAVKHAFPTPRTGAVRVQMDRRLPGEIRLRVSDDGVGLPAGFALHGGATLGVALVATLTEQIDGTLRLGEGPGTTFEITFPERDPRS